MIATPTHYVAILLPGTNKKYFFSTSIEDLKPGDEVVVETSEGRGVGKVLSVPIKLASYTSDIPLKPVLRRPTEDDYEAERVNRDGEKAALYVAEREIKKLGLPMRPMSAHFDLEGSKCTINFTSDNRVDFRELVKILAHELDCRIELHQVASRDRAKMVGGIGICGLPLCCSTFIQEFTGISLSLAKNQMLTINIPKLSGHCGKLICCLAYEDPIYTEEKKDFPRLGTVIGVDGTSYKVDGYNVLSRTVKLSAPGDIKNVTLEEYRDLEKRSAQGYSKKPSFQNNAKPASSGPGHPAPNPSNSPAHGQGNSQPNNHNNQQKRPQKPAQNRNNGQHNRPDNRPKGQGKGPKNA